MCAVTNSRLLLLLALPMLWAGCGYRFVRYQQADGAAPRICVVTLQNDSQEAGVELLASQALRHEILTRGGLELVSNCPEAQFTLEGRVLPLRTRSRSFTGVVLAREYEVMLRLELRVDPGTADAAAAGNAAIGREQFQAAETYLASADAAVMRKNRQEALRYLSGLLASRVHDAIDRRLLGVLP